MSNENEADRLNRIEEKIAVERGRERTTMSNEQLAILLSLIEDAVVHDELTESEAERLIDALNALD